MQPATTQISRWSGKAIHQPTAAKSYNSQTITFGSFPGVPAYPQGAIDPNSLIGNGHATFRAASSQDSYVVVTPMCQTAAALPSGESRIQSSVTTPEMPAGTQAALDPEGSYYVVTPMCESAKLSERSCPSTSIPPPHSPASSQAALHPKSTPGKAAVSPAPAEGDFVVATPMCKTATAQPPEQSHLGSSSSDAGSIPYEGTPSPSICRRPSTASVASCLPRQDKLNGQPLLASVSTPKLQQTPQATEAEAKKPDFTLPRIGSLRSLLSALQAAKASEVAGLLGRLAFQPRAPAFTKMLQQCGTDVAKAFELWLAMHRTPGVKANTISYSVIIRICAQNGHAELADKIFGEQVQDAKADKDCQPILITYRHLITGLIKANKADRAMQWLHHMNASCITADEYFYNCIVQTALQANASWDYIAAMFKEMHGLSMLATSDTYILVLQRVNGEEGWGRASELFTCTLWAGAYLSPQVFHTMMTIYKQSGQPGWIECLLDRVMQQGYCREEEEKLAYAALHIYAQNGLHDFAARQWERFWCPRKMANGHIAGLVYGAFHMAGLEPYPGLLW